LVLSVTFLFVCEISREPLNGFLSDSQGRRVWSLSAASNCQLLAVPHYRLNTYGYRAFSVAGPTVWNSLPILSGTRPSVQTVSDACLRRVCLLDTSALSPLEVIDDYCAIQIYLLTYLTTTVFLDSVPATVVVTFCIFMNL